MATKVRGDERRGQDDDDLFDPGTGRKVQIENSYFEKLKARLSQGDGTTTGRFPATAEPGNKPKSPGFVVYGDDGRPID